MDDITSHLRREQQENAIALAGAMLTDALIDVLGEALANRSAAEIRRLFKLVLPAESSRFGIALPYFAADKLSSFPIRARDLVLLLCGSFAGGSEALYAYWAGLKRLSSTGNTGGPGLFSTSFYKDEGRLANDLEGQRITPVDLKTRSNTVSDASLWSLMAVLPTDFGTGFSGSTPLKGNIAIGGMSEPGSRVDPFDPSLIEQER